MGAVRITSLYPKFNGSHFGLPPSSMHKMTGLGGKMVWMMMYAHRPHFDLPPSLNFMAFLLGKMKWFWSTVDISCMPCLKRCASFRPNLLTSERYSRDLFKGSVERPLLPWAIFLIFTRNRPWKSEDHLCTLFFIEMSRERLEKKRKNTASFVASLGAGVQPRSPYNFSCLSAVSKNGHFRSFLLGFLVSFGEEKPFLTSNASF